MLILHCKNLAGFGRIVTLKIESVLYILFRIFCTVTWNGAESSSSWTIFCTVLSSLKYRVALHFVFFGFALLLFFVLSMHGKGCWKVPCLHNVQCFIFLSFRTKRPVTISLMTMIILNQRRRRLVRIWTGRWLFRFNTLKLILIINLIMLTHPDQLYK